MERYRFESRRPPGVRAYKKGHGSLCGMPWPFLYRRAAQNVRDAAQRVRRPCAGGQGGKEKDVRALRVETAARASVCRFCENMGKQKVFAAGVFSSRRAYDMIKNSQDTAGLNADTGGKQMPVAKNGPGRRWRTLAVDILYDLVGNALYAVAICVFAKHAPFAPSGVSGLAVIMNHIWSGLPIGTLTLALNVPIALVSYRVVGRAFLLKSLRTILIGTLFVDVLFARVPAYTGDPLLAALFMGVFLGSGLALVYMRGSSTGGADFLVMAAKKKFPFLSMGQLALGLNGLIILGSGLAYQSLDAVLYGAVATFTSSTVMDKLLYGAGSGKLALIITSNGKATAEAINLMVRRGATLLPAYGAYSGQQRELLMCVCSKSEIYKVQSAAQRIDPQAFMMITEASEIYGNGFKTS